MQAGRDLFLRALTYFPLCSHKGTPDTLLYLILLAALDYKNSLIGLIHKKLKKLNDKEGKIGVLTRIKFVYWFLLFLFVT